MGKSMSTVNCPPLNSILYVEGEADIRFVAKTVLAAMGGFAVRACGCSEEALLAAAQSRHDLILLDASASGNCVAILARLRALPHMATIPVMFTATRMDSEDMALFDSLGAIGVIAKPFDPMRMTEQLRHLWERNAMNVAPALNDS